MHKELKKFYLALAVTIALAITFALECGWVSMPHFAPAVSHSATATAPAPAPTATTPSVNTDPVFCGEAGCPPTPEQLEAETKMWKQFASTVGDNWVQILTFGGIIVGGFAAFMFWRRWKRSKHPIIVDKKGKELPQPPSRKFEQAELILPGDARFADLTFEKVIGQKEAKFDIMEFLDFLQNPGKYTKLKARMPRGVLLFGAPGTGKTLLVKALAAHAGIPVLVIAGSDFVEMFVGVGASRIRDLYEDADNLAKVYGWCVVFIDEIDAVGGKRGGGRGDGGNREHDQTINQLLVELDGVTTNPNVLTIGASNRKDMLDPALLRPKRLDRHIEFFNPNRKDREELFALYLPEDIRDADVDLKKAARVTASASGSHIEAMANEAKIFAARLGLDKVNHKCLDEGILKVRMGPARDSDRAMMTPDEMETVKVHEGGHALVYWKITGRAPERFTIIPRGATGGHVEFSEDYEMLRTKENLETHLAVAMGGWASTIVLRNGQQDTGISSDFDQATRIAAQMVMRYGMSPMGFVTIDPLAEANLVSDNFKDKINEHINALLESAKERAYKIVSENKPLLQKMIDAVGKKETLLSHDFEALLSGCDIDDCDDEEPPKNDGDKPDDQDPEIKLPEPIDAAKSDKSAWRSLTDKLKPGMPEWLRRGEKGKCKACS